MRIVIAFLLVVSITDGLAQPRVGVRLDQVKSPYDTYIITYVAPATSVYATPAFEDTLFCATIVKTLHGTRGMVLPMKRIDSSLYRVQLTMPDSAYGVRFEICIPTERAPEGILETTLRPDTSEFLPGSAIASNPNADSALAFERRLYPWNYYAYYQHWQAHRNTLAAQKGGISRASVAMLIDSLLRVLQSVRTPTFNWYLTVALFHGDRIGGDSLQHLYLDSAVQAQLRSKAHDPLLENSALWDRAFAPELLENKEVKMQVGRTAHLLDLAAAYPRSELGKTWSMRSSGFSQLDTMKVNAIFNEWATSYDVDILNAIGSRLMIKTSPLYNPARAEQYFKRAETSSAQQLGFRNGENIFGSMGRLDRIRSSIVDSYSEQGRHADALEFGENAMRKAENAYGRQKISEAQVRAAKAAGDTVLAERYNKYELPVVSDFAYEAMDGSKSRLADYKGKVIVLDFWFIGCAGCIIEHKSLNEFGIRYQNDPRVVFLSVALNDKPSLEKYLARSPLTATVVPNGEALSDTLGVTAFPTHVIIDQKGKTVLWDVGGTTKSGEQLGKEVEKLLK